MHEHASYKKQPTTDKLIEFKKRRAVACRIIKTSKENSWKNYVNSMKTNTPLSEVWRKVNAIKGYNTMFRINSLTKPAITTDNQEIAEILADSFYVNSSSSNYSDEFLTYKNQKEQEYMDTLNIETEYNPINEEISWNKLQEAIKSLKSSSPGPDNIHNFFLKNLPLNGQTYLLNIFNRVWNNQVFPEQWRLSTVIPILKPNKKKIDPKSYRPISLTSTLCKLLEKILNKRLQWYLETNHVLHKNQSGFRIHRSTNDNILNIQTEILDAFAVKQQLSSLT